MEADSKKPLFLRHGLDVLAQFENAEVVLDRAEIEQMTGVSCWTAERCLGRLSGLGYLDCTPDGRYRLAGQSKGTHAWRSEDDAADATT
ncbi:MAG TPA: hypothetical protein VK672_02025 [Solirubrobacteraceae bacterium]|nr:hypothetical protein [Solirubrobacteraceae bacterium]